MSDNNEIEVVFDGGLDKKQVKELEKQLDGTGAVVNTDEGIKISVPVEPVNVFASERLARTAEMEAQAVAENAVAQVSQDVQVKEVSSNL